MEQGCKRRSKATKQRWRALAGEFTNITTNGNKNRPESGWAPLQQMGKKLAFSLLSEGLSRGHEIPSLVNAAKRRVFDRSLESKRQDTKIEMTKASIGIPAEVTSGENRVAITPSGAAELVGVGYKVLVEFGAGIRSKFADGDYVKAGAILVDKAEAFHSDIVVKLHPPKNFGLFGQHESDLLQEGASLVCFAYKDEQSYPAMVQQLASKKVTCYGLNCIPQFNKLSHVLNTFFGGYVSQEAVATVNTLALNPGEFKFYKAVVVGSSEITSETACALKNLGLNVKSYDPIVEKTEHLRDSDGLVELCMTADVIISTFCQFPLARVASSHVPTLVSHEIVECMKPGAVILDLVGNVEISRGTSFTDRGVVCIGLAATEIYSREISDICSEYITQFLCNSKDALLGKVEMELSHYVLMKQGIVNTSFSIEDVNKENLLPEGRANDPKDTYDLSASYQKELDRLRRNGFSARWLSTIHSGSNFTLNYSKRFYTHTRPRSRRHRRRGGQMPVPQDVLWRFAGGFLTALSVGGFMATSAFPFISFVPGMKLAAMAAAGGALSCWMAHRGGVDLQPVQESFSTIARCLHLRTDSALAAHRPPWTFIPVGFVVLVAMWVYASQMLMWTGTFAEIPLNNLIMHFSLFMTAWSLVQAVFTNPGDVPEAWHVSNLGASLTDFRAPKKGYELKNNGRVRYCRRCWCYKPDRTHHDSNSDSCVLKMDHHCPWINNTVGHRNQKFFLLFVMYSTLSSIFATATSYPALWSALKFLCTGYTAGPPNALHIAQAVNFVFANTTAAVLAVTLSSFFYFHVNLALHNLTTIEFLEKRDKFRSQGYPNLYDLGVRENLISIFGEDWKWWALPVATTPGDGVIFPTRLSLD